MSSAERKNVLSDSKQCKKKTKNFKREKKEQKNSFIAFLSTLEIFLFFSRSILMQKPQLDQLMNCLGRKD